MSFFLSQKFTLHLLALDKILTGLQPPLAKDEPADNISRWLNEVRNSQNYIDSVIIASESSNEEVVTRLR